MNLTAEQIRTLDKNEPVPLEIQGRRCILLSGAAYDRVRELFDDWDPSTMRRHMAEMMADDWADASMSVYDD